MLCMFPECVGRDAYVRTFYRPSDDTTILLIDGLLLGKGGCERKC